MFNCTEFADNSKPWNNDATMIDAVIPLFMTWVNAPAILAGEVSACHIRVSVPFPHITGLPGPSVSAGGWSGKR